MIRKQSSFSGKQPAPSEINHVLSLLSNGQHSEAVHSARTITLRFPKFGFGWMLLGSALTKTGFLVDALLAMRTAVELSPKNLEALNNLGSILQAIGHLEEAEAAFRRALKIKRNFAEAHSNLGNTLKDLGRVNEAIASYQQALQINPRFADAHYNLGTILQSLGRLEEAKSCFESAVQLDEDDYEACNNLGLVLEHLGKSEQAQNWFQRALKANQSFAEAHYNLGNIFRDTGSLEDAVLSYQRAIQINPEYVVARSNMLLTYSYMPNLATDEALAESRKFGELVAQHARPYSHWNTPPDPNRRLRIGFVSGDMRNHSVGYFLEGALAALVSNAASRLEIIAYSNHSQSDELTARIKSCCKVWRSTIGMSDEKLAQQVRDDRVDILIDLSGHTAHNRLPVFAWKAAPIQASWLGYCATTGVADIDYYIADARTLPPELEHQFTEHIWRLPESYLCFCSPSMPVTVGPLPAKKVGYVTFGSFNNATKMTENVVAVWARILNAVPNSRLMLKAKQFGEPDTRIKVQAQYAAHGISLDRLKLTDHIAGRNQHLDAYNDIDIGLDPFPYNGVTTTVEALWMGVPVISLTGDRFLSRQGVGILHSVGLSDWISADIDDYVEKATTYALNLDKLQQLRSGLRQQVVESPIMDSSSFATNFEAALRTMWVRWCRQQDQ